MKKFGLPIFPLQSGMVLGMRDQDEIEWLLEHGVIQSDLYCYRKILKSSGRYRLIKQADDRYETPDQTVAEATSLQALLHDHKIDLATWRWYESYDMETDTSGDVSASPLHDSSTEYSASRAQVIDGTPKKAIKEDKK